MAVARTCHQIHVNSGVCDLMCILGQRGIVLMGVVLDYVIRPILRHSEILVEMN